MAKFRVTAVSFIGGRTVNPGEIIEYDGIPGSKLEPVDSDAKVAKEKAMGSSLPFRDRPMYKPAPINQQKPELIEIPENWKDMSAPGRIALAKSLGSAATKAKDADTFIEDELVKRATV